MTSEEQERLRWMNESELVAEVERLRAALGKCLAFAKSGHAKTTAKNSPLPIRSALATIANIAHLALRDFGAEVEQ